MYCRIALISSVLLASGCGGGPIPSLDANDVLVLYSINGRGFPPGTKPQTIETFHTYPVLGKLDVKDSMSRKAIVQAVNKSIARGNSRDQNKCFWPRHGIRVTKGETTTDYLICFECHNYLAVTGAPNESQMTPAISDYAKPLLNKYLTNAEIPIAK